MDATAPVKKMGKLRASYLLTVESFELLRKDKEVVGYVLLNLLSLLAVSVVFIGGYFLIAMGGALPMEETATDVGEAMSLVEYGVAFLFYLMVCFVTTYFSVALTSVVAARINGGDKSFGDGLTSANKHVGKIMVWSFLTATVGVILNFLGERFSWVGKLLGFAGEVAWKVMSYFMVPVLALEDLSVRASLARSGTTFRQTWGETIISNFSLGLFMGLLELLVVIATVILAVVVSPNIPLVILVVVLGILVFAAACILHSTLEAIVKVVLYHYATSGGVPDSFTPELIIGALKKKEGTMTVPQPPSAI